jgi:hypothetical protein
VLSRRTPWARVGVAAIACVTAAVYWESLSHIGRADYLEFLVPTRHYDDWWPLVRDFYSYARVTDQDPFIFRPVHFATLATERAFFGPLGFTYYQLVSLVLHLLCVGTLLRILVDVDARWPAYLFTAFFGVLYVWQEAVIWSVMVGVLLCTLFMLEALRRFLLTVRGNFTNRRQLAAAVVCFTLAALSNEIAIPIAFICGVIALLYLVRNHRRDWSVGVWLFLPPLVYAGLNEVDKMLHPADDSSSIATILQDFEFWKTVQGTAWIVFHWTYGGLFPNAQRMLVSERILWNFPATVSDFVAGFRVTALSAVTFGLLLAMALAFVRGRTRRIHASPLAASHDFPWVLLLSTIAVSLPLILVLGRYNKLAIDYARVTTYYT